MVLHELLELNQPGRTTGWDGIVCTARTKSTRTIGWDYTAHTARPKSTRTMGWDYTARAVQPKSTRVHHGLRLYCTHCSIYVARSASTSTFDDSQASDLDQHVDSIQILPTKWVSFDEGTRVLRCFVPTFGVLTTAWRSRVACSRCC